MKGLERYSKILSIVLAVMAFVCTVLTIKQIWAGENFVTAMIFAICFWIVSGGSQAIWKR